MKYGYKVIHRWKSGQMISCIDLPSRMVEYFVDKWTEPKKGNGPLAVFSDLIFAKNFVLSSMNMEIYKCKYILSDKESVWSDYSVLTKKFFPEGTRLADKVMIFGKPVEVS
jgi:hypothetical protein